MYVYIICIYVYRISRSEYRSVRQIQQRHVKERCMVKTKLCIIPSNEAIHKAVTNDSGEVYLKALEQIYAKLL